MTKENKNQPSSRYDISVDESADIQAAVFGTVYAVMNDLDENGNYDHGLVTQIMQRLHTEAGYPQEVVDSLDAEIQNLGLAAFD